MSARTMFLTCTPFLAGLLLLAVVPAQGQEAADKGDDVEVLTRGPIHEAYADPGVTPTEAPPIVPKQPPDPIDEAVPDQKPEGENITWIPGYFDWDEDRENFIYVSGFWRALPPGRTWVPGSWRQVDDGWQRTPGFWAAAEQENIQFLPPPPAPLEAVPATPAPSPDSIYTPGVWVYRDARYLWRPGVWITYRPGWVWVPAHYVWTPVGWVFVDGYWDYPLRNRGLLFAPVYFTGRPWLRRGWFYTPSYAVYDDFVIGALFLRPRWGSYWFGDYFGPAYERRGFVAWIDIRFGRGVYDPLFGFYLRFHRDNRTWDRDLRALYATRNSGENLPPRTLTQQTTIIQNTTNVTNIKNVTVVAPLAKIDPSVVKLQTVPRDQLLSERKAIQRFRDAGAQRNRLETQLLAKGGAPVKATDPPRTAKLDLPVTTKPLTTVKPPPLPVHAALETKPKDAKPLDLHKSKDFHTSPGVTPKKDTPPPVKKDAPPAKKDPPPPPPPPPPKKDAPMDKKGKDKDKEKDKKQAATSAPPLRLASAKSVAATEIKPATPVRHEIATRTPARQEVKAVSPAPTSKPAEVRRQELHASAHASPGHGAKENGKEKH
jgi:hypothetical protein